MDLLVQSLKANNLYENTIIVFTTDNGGAVNSGGNNWPLRGTKGTLFEGGTRAIGFVHSPLLRRTGYRSQHLMHAVDWLPTLLSAAGEKSNVTVDGVDQWRALEAGNDVQPRQELVYNIKEKPFMAALRVGEYKMIWGSRTTKDTWFPAQEDPVNKQECSEVLRSRTQMNRSRILIPRGLETVDTLDLDIDIYNEYQDDYDFIEQQQSDVVVDDDIRTGKSQEDTSQEARKGDINKKGKKRKKNKKKGGKRKKNLIPNKFGVRVKPFGDIQLYNLKTDPEEKLDISEEAPEMTESIKNRIMEHFYDLYPRHVPDDSDAGKPENWGGYYGPGWCDAMNILDHPTEDF